MVVEKIETDEERQRRLELDLSQLQENQPRKYDVYYKSLLEEQLANGHRAVSIETKEKLLEAAESGISANPKKMEREWESHTKNGRPPIGGAQE